MASPKDPLRTAFNKIDKNGDGALSIAEIMAALENAGQKPALAEVSKMVAEIDTSGV